MLFFIHDESFFSCCFKTLSLSCLFEFFIIMGLGVNLFVFILLGGH